MPGPNSNAHQVLIYSGPGVSPLSLSHTLLTLSLLLLPHYTVQPATPELLSTQPWEPNCALLVIPGGRDLPFVESLSMKSNVTKRIKEFVSEGGRYLGICAGAYFASREVLFDVGGDMEVRGERDLAFYPGTCAGPTFPGFAYAAESGSRAVSLSLEPSSSSSSSPGPSSAPKTLKYLYYNGGGHFLNPESFGRTTEIIARYADTPDHKVAAVLNTIEKGKALLCAVHFEYPLNDPPAKDAITKCEVLPNKEEVDASDKARIEWVGELLVKLGLEPPGHSILGDDSGGQGLVSQGEEDPAILLHPTHPSPIFVLPLPLLPELGSSSFKSKAISEKLIQAEGVREEMILRDANDELHITTTENFGESSSSNLNPVVENVTSVLARKRRKPPKPQPEESLPPMDELSLENSSKSPVIPHPPDFHSLPKTIILPSKDVSYSPSWTPLFNFETYWSELEVARKRFGKKFGKEKKDGNVSLGDLVWYAETVTSTQTMLDRNPILLQNLPTPLAFLASFQLTGRGRGSNIWLSPPGCLQFSLLLTLPNQMSSKLVFVQYLMALAVCEAVDDDGRLGVRIKWPNDLYAEVEGVGGSTVGSGKKGRAKLGGILVNTNYVGGQWRLVVGCGFNVLNALPTTSLSQLHSLLSSRQPLSGNTNNKPLPQAPTMEATFANIMKSFESKWEQFITEKGFEGFMDEYHSRWLHSNQEVLLTTVTPHQKLKIKSITPDHGLLRCVPIEGEGRHTSSRGLTPLYDRGDYGDDRTSSGGLGKKSEYVDLQPDGNSFDMMSGLIKRKT